MSGMRFENNRSSRGMRPYARREEEEEPRVIIITRRKQEPREEPPIEDRIKI